MNRTFEEYLDEAVLLPAPVISEARSNHRKAVELLLEGEGYVGGVLATIENEMPNHPIVVKMKQSLRVLSGAIQTVRRLKPEIK